MKTIVCLLVLFALSYANPQGKYTDRFDNINLDEIINNRRLLIAYINCVLEKGKCTAEGRELKSHIKDALETHCEKCTDTQRKGSRRVIGHLINNEPKYWTLLTDKYDPTHKWATEYENELRSIAG